jgi:hypothetical protein
MRGDWPREHNHGSGGDWECLIGEPAVWVGSAFVKPAWGGMRHILLVRGIAKYVFGDRYLLHYCMYPNNILMLILG